MSDPNQGGIKLEPGDLEACKAAMQLEKSQDDYGGTLVWKAQQATGNPNTTYVDPQFICVQCSQLTQNCTCDHTIQGAPFETDLAWRQKVIAKLDAIEQKVDQLIDELLGA